MHHEVIVKVQEVLKHCQSQKLKELEIVISLLGIQARLHLGSDFTSSILLLQNAEEESHLLTLRDQSKAIFLETKILLNYKLYEHLVSHISTTLPTQIYSINASNLNKVSFLSSKSCSLWSWRLAT